MTDGYRRRVEPVERVATAAGSMGAALVRACLALAGILAVAVSGAHLVRLLGSGAIEISGATVAMTLVLPLLAVAAFVAASSRWTAR